MIDILQQNEAINTGFCINSEEGVDQTGAKVEVRYKLFQKRKGGVLGCYSKLTINLYNTSSRLLANGPRIDIMTDIILKDILDILQQKYYAIVIVDQNIKESISACKVQDQLQVQNNNGKSNVTTNEQDVLQEMCDQDSSQVTEKTVIDAIDDEEDDIVECPVCNKSAMSGVIQCEECWMWLHNECARINEDKVSRITNSSPFICISCNDQKTL